MQVKHLHADIYKYYQEKFLFRYVNYKVTSEYVSDTKYNIIITRVDANEGWTDELQILIYHSKLQFTDIIDIPPNQTNQIILYLTYPEGNLEPSSVSDATSLFISCSSTITIVHSTRNEFNKLFNSNIRMLPHDLYAVGVFDPSTIMVYNETFQSYYDIYHPIQHIVNVAVQNQKYPVYFLISSNDGYNENTYYEPDCLNWTGAGDSSAIGRNGTFAGRSGASGREYPIYYSKRFILCQSSHQDFPYTINIPDRHYFYHNLYNSFRSFHLGIPFQEKLNQIVYAGQDRGSKFNFKNNRSIQVSPRTYFKSEIAPKYSCIWCSEEWFDRQQMVNFKYILDIDGIASTWDATAWKLNSGSVIFKPKSSWTQWFYDKYLPNVHFIEIEDDFSDIEEKYKWCEEHQEECEGMVERCLALFQEVYSYDNVVKYTISVLDKLMNAPDIKHVSDFLDRIYYINLDRRIDRNNHIQNELKRVIDNENSFLWERFSGIVHQLDQEGLNRAQRFVNMGWYKDIQHSTGIIGCTRSHLEIFKQAKEKGYQNILILEDDFQFLVSKEEFYQEMKQLFESNLDFDVCMLSYKLIEWEECPNTPFVKRIKEAQTASGYIVRYSYLDTLISLYETTLPLLELTGQHWLYANDQCWKLLQSSDKWYAFSTRIGKQIDGYSDNAGKFMSYDF